jgi:Asp-tRNA(Asn)/Glu-tRNA(Gln) amidotransferase A subunit family amidase
MDAGSLAAAIRQGELRSTEATETYIRHLQRLNEEVNCLTQERFEEARQEAARADELVKSGQAAGRLLGVPITIKDCFHIAGMRTTAGLKHRQDIIEQEDAEIVRLLRDEGAVILGKTNTPQLCFCQETDNTLHGRTNNPWNLERTAGGSSGGEGACIAAGGAAVGIGADIGGSIRFPSHCNGVVGFKSGNGQVPDRGNFPDVTIPEQARMLGIGALAKSVADARLIHEIIAYRPPVRQDLSDYRIVFPGEEPAYPLNQAAADALSQLQRSLQTQFTVEEETPPYYEESALIWQQVMSIGGARHIRELMSADGILHPAVEYVKGKVTGNSDIHPYLSWALIGAGMFKPSSSRIAEIRQILQRGDELLNEYLEGSILILPVYHSAAPKHGQLYRELFSIRRTFLKYIPYVAYANVWGLPSLIVPVAEDADGMPIGVQLISQNGNEDALFQLGERIEQQFRGYVRCRQYD